MFLEWKSNEKCFEYYDKEKKEKILVDLPLKFAFLEHYHTVKGFHEGTQTGIYSNEVYGVGFEELTVKTFKGLEIAEGLYKENKTKIKNAGGNYYRSIYGVFENGQIVNIALKGASIGGIKKEKSVDGKEHDGYSDFCKKNENQFEKKWIHIDSFVDGKSGSVKYTVPVFSLGKEFTSQEDNMIVESATQLQQFVTSRNKPDTVSAVDKHEEEPKLVGKDDF